MGLVSSWANFLNFLNFWGSRLAFLCLRAAVDFPIPSTNTNPASRAGHVREGEGIWFEKRWAWGGLAVFLHQSTSPHPIRIQCLSRAQHRVLRSHRLFAVSRLPGRQSRDCRSPA